MASGLALVALCLAQSPGRLTADTKLDLAVNPLGLLGRALHLWDPAAGFGQLQNQAQGYLFPVGPFFAVTDAVGLPMWLAQRLWIGLLLSVACAGTVLLADELRIGTPPGRVAAGLAYGLSSHVMILLGSLSALALPAALAPWAIIPLVGGANSGSPARAAARSGVVVALMGAVNAGTTLAVLVLPALWLVTRQAGPRRRALAWWWVAAVGLACAWWVAGLLVEGRYGFGFLRYIERARSTTAASSAPEAIRGTANWLAHYVFGGRPWWRGGWLLVSAPAAILAGTALASAGLAGLATRTLPERRFLVLSLLLGVTLTAAGHAGPLGGPFADDVHRALDGPLVAFRSFAKFGPLVALPLALGLAHALASLRLARVERALTTALVALVLAGAALPLLRGEALPDGTFRRVPAHWSQTADWLAANSGGGRALLVPASGFGEYRWGRTIDEPMQPLAESPWAVRNQVPLGSAGLTRLLDAIEQRLVEGRPTPGMAVVLARSGVRHLVARNDLDWNRAGAPSPARVRAVLQEAEGIRPVASFGPPLPPDAVGREGEAGSQGRFSAVDIYQVDGDVSRAVAYPADAVTVLSGGPEALLQLADRRHLSGGVVLAGDAPTGGEPLVPASRWAVTDGMQRRDVDFGLVHRGKSFVLQESQEIAGRPPRDRVPVEGLVHQTVAVLEGATTVRASSYANAVSRHPEAQPVAAFDGNPATAWETGAPATSEGEWVEVDLPEARSFAEVTVRLLHAGPGAPRATRLRITTDGGSTEAALVDTEDPQSLAAPPGPTTRVRITLLGVVDERPWASLGRAGLREVDLPGVEIKRFLAAPDDEADRFRRPGSAPLYAFDRAGATPDEIGAASEEDRLARQFEVPTAARFELSGTLRARNETELDELLASLGADGSQADDAAPFSLPCGRGPGLMLDGRPVATAVTGVTADLRRQREMRFSACDGPVELTAGTHRLETDPVDPLAIVSATLAGEGWAGGDPTPRQRAIDVRRWDGNHRTVTVAPGERSVIAVSENFNRGWTAIVDGRRLRPVRLEGWRQGWVLPAGDRSTVDIRFGPDRIYRAALAGGAFLLVVLAFLAWRGTGSRKSALAPAGPSNGRWLTAGGAGVCLLTLGGVVALAVPALLVLLGASAVRRGEWATGERPWSDVRSGAVPVAIAAAAFLIAGVVEALHPTPGLGVDGPFARLTQLGALVALGAVVVAALVPTARPGGGDAGSGAHLHRRGMSPPGRPSPGQEDGGQAGAAGEEPVEPTGGPGHVVVPGAGQLHVDEAVGPQPRRQGPGGEEAEVPDHDPSRPSEDTDAAHLREHRLNPHEQQEAVEPGGQVRGREDERPPGGEHPADLGEGPVGIDQVLDHLAQKDDVEAPGGKGQPGAVDAGPHGRKPSPAGGDDGRVRPVEGHDGGAGDRPGDEGGDGAVATADVEHPQSPARRAGDGLQHPQLDVDPVSPERDAAVDPFVERPQ